MPWPSVIIPTTLWRKEGFNEPSASYAERASNSPDSFQFPVSAAHCCYQGEEASTVLLSTVNECAGLWPTVRRTMGPQRCPPSEGKISTSHSCHVGERQVHSAFLGGRAERWVAVSDTMRYMRGRVQDRGLFSSSGNSQL